MVKSRLGKDHDLAPLNWGLLWLFLMGDRTTTAGESKAALSRNVWKAYTVLTFRSGRVDRPKKKVVSSGIDR
jgi:hypothetical protein